MKILYFYEMTPTQEEVALAEKDGVHLRDSCSYHSGDFLETCDGVMGKAPQAYVDKYGMVELEEAQEPKTKAKKVSKPKETVDEQKTNAAIHV